uniref:Clp ATPase C-terminal domain-containing protein n=1 Tax=Oryza glaberrima TaxID=4538 RepID=I1QZ83_ORYGL
MPWAVGDRRTSGRQDGSHRRPAPLFDGGALTRACSVCTAARAAREAAPYYGSSEKRRYGMILMYGVILNCRRDLFFFPACVALDRHIDAKTPAVTAADGGSSLSRVDSTRYGARPLRRAVVRLLEDTLAERMFTREVGEGDLVIVDADSAGKCRGQEEQHHAGGLQLPTKCATIELDTYENFGKLSKYFSDSHRIMYSLTSRI